MSVLLLSRFANLQACSMKNSIFQVWIKRLFNRLIRAIIINNPVPRKSERSVLKEISLAISSKLLKNAFIAWTEQLSAFIFLQQAMLTHLKKYEMAPSRDKA